MKENNQVSKVQGYEDYSLNKVRIISQFLSIWYIMEVYFES